MSRREEERSGGMEVCWGLGLELGFGSDLLELRRWSLQPLLTGGAAEGGKTAGEEMMDSASVISLTTERWTDGAVGLYLIYGD